MHNFNYRLYIYGLSVLALLAYIITYITFGITTPLSDIFVWAVLAVVAETFHIILPSNAATSVGMAVYLATLVTTNDPFVVMLMPLFSFLLRAPEVEGRRRHLFTYHYTIILYNIASHVLILGTISYIYKMLGVHSDGWSTIIAYSIFLVSICELLSIIFISIYFYTRNNKQRIPLIKSFIGALPSTWAVGTLGLILAFARISYELSVVILVFIPLLLARYSFKLYFDSQKSSQETIEALNEALFVRDAYTAGHTTRVEEYAILLAKATNYTAKDLETLTRAAKLHDIGKIGVPDGILNKPGKLTQEEYFQIRDHAAMGHKILSNVDSLKKVAEVVRHHHERPDGKGYPDGLKDNEIPRDSAILAIADTFDAMTSDRPYRKALSKEQALAELEKYKGTQFNQFLAEVFISIMKEYDSRKPQEVVAITEVAKHEHVDEKKVASTTLSKAVARHKKETVRLAEEVAE